MPLSLYTKGFRRDYLLTQHWADHGDDFDAQTELEYLLLADDFLGGNPAEGVLECIRRGSKKDRIRYDPSTQAFGVLDPNGYILTYYKPVPLVHHRFGNNLQYFREECKK